MALPNVAPNAMPIQAAVQTTTKTKVSVGQLAAVLVGLVVVSGLLGFFSGGLSYSMIVNTPEFKAAGGKPGGGGKPQATLQVSLSAGVLPQTVVAGTRDHIFTGLVLDASALTKDTEVWELNFTVTTNNQANPAEVSNWSLYDGNIQLGTTNDPDANSSTKVHDGESATIKFTLTNPIVIFAGSSKVLTVKGTITTAAIDGTMQVGIQDSLNNKIVDAYQAGSNKAIEPTYQFTSTKVVPGLYGEVVKTAASAELFYIGYRDDNYGRFFSPKRDEYDPFLTWFQDESSVQTISQTEMDSYPLRGNVTIRPGTNLLKIATDPIIFAVIPNGSDDYPRLTYIGLETNPSALENLYGSNWQQRVVVIPDAYFVNYSIAADWTLENRHPNGTLIQYAGSSEIYLIDNVRKRKFRGNGFDANRYKMDFVVTNVDPNVFIYPDGSLIRDAEPALLNVAGSLSPQTDYGFSSGPLMTFVNTGQLSITQNSDTPPFGLNPS